MFAGVLDTLLKALVRDSIDCLKCFLHLNAQNSTIILVLVPSDINLHNFLGGRRHKSS